MPRAGMLKGIQNGTLAKKTFEGSQGSQRRKSQMSTLREGNEVKSKPYSKLFSRHSAGQIT